jgi:O-antigen/teichoic acid export membrane protein
VRKVSAALACPAAWRGFLSVLDQGVFSGTNFATSVIIGRLCSRETLGVYSLALSVVFILRGIQGELVSTPYMIYCNRRQGQGLAAYTGSTLVHHLLLSVVGMVCLAGLAGLLALGVGPGALAPVAWVLVGVLPFLLLRNYLRHLAFSHLQVGAGLALVAGVAVFQVGGLLLLWSAGLLGVGSAFAVMGAACAAVCLVWFAVRKQPVRLEPARLGPDWRQNWAFGKWALASFLIGSTTPYVMPWALAIAHGEAAAGMLAACQTVINLASTYAAGVANFLTPRAAAAFAEGGLPALRRVLKGTAVLYAVTLGAFFLAVWLSGDRLATLIFGSRYAGTAPVLAILALSLLVNSLGMTAGNGLWALERPQANFTADMGTFVATMAGIVCLVGPLGVLGTALATLAGTTTGTVLRTFSLLRMAHDLAPLAGPGGGKP